MGCCLGFCCRGHEEYTMQCCSKVTYSPERGATRLVFLWNSDTVTVATRMCCVNTPAARRYPAVYDNGCKIQGHNTL